MKIEIEIEEIENESECTEEYVSSLSFTDCTRKDLEELGKFFLLASKSLPPARIRPGELQASQMFLNKCSEHFKDHATDISVSLETDEP